MDLSRKEIDDLYFNNADTLVVNDCTVIQIEEPDNPSTFGLVLQISHIETGIGYRQIFLMSEQLTRELTLLLREHLKHERGNGFLF